MKTPDSSPSSPPSDPENWLLLPSPEAIKSLTDDATGAISDECHSVLADLQKCNGAVSPEEVKTICDRVIAEYAIADTTADGLATTKPEGHGPIYDFYFAVQRLPASTGKDAMLRALAVALAVVMKNSAALEQGTSGISPIEFGLLRQAFAVVVESLRELSINPK
jgi:hypothetical protein